MVPDQRVRRTGVTLTQHRTTNRRNRAQWHRSTAHAQDSEPSFRAPVIGASADRHAVQSTEPFPQGTQRHLRCATPSRRHGALTRQCPGEQDLATFTSDQIKNLRRGMTLSKPRHAPCLVLQRLPRRDRVPFRVGRRTSRSPGDSERQSTCFITPDRLHSFHTESMSPKNPAEHVRHPYLPGRWSGEV